MNFDDSWADPSPKAPNSFGLKLFKWGTFGFPMDFDDSWADPAPKVQNGIGLKLFKGERLVFLVILTVPEPIWPRRLKTALLQGIVEASV